MRSKTNNVRRATQDLDIDFIKYSLADESIDIFIEKLNCLGVHNRFELEQEEYCFDIAYDDEGASLLINSDGQMFAEKLRSLLKFGSLSTRFKDVYDMYYLKNTVNMTKLLPALDTYIFQDASMREIDGKDVVKRLRAIFSDKVYIKSLDNSNKRWIDEDIHVITKGLLDYVDNI